MKIIKQGSLILLLAAFFIFSISISAAFDEQPVKSWVEPDTKNSVVGSCNPYYAPSSSTKIDLQSCVKLAETAARKTGADAKWDMGTIYTEQFDYYGIVAFWVYLEVHNTSGGYVTAAKWVTSASEESKVCPPESNPAYKIGPVPESESNPTHMVCKPQFKPCPLGFYRNAVSSTSGGAEQCVPIQCPAKGTATRDIKNLKDVIPNGVAGTYCDGLCNYSIDLGGIGYQGQQFASGVSMGSQCGQSPVDGQKFTPNGDEKNCLEHTLSNGSLFLECQGGTDEPDPDTDNPLPDSSTAEVPQDPVIDPFTGVECTTVDDKMSCVGGNITDAITKQTKDQAKLDAERHNKLVKQQEEITAYIEKQQDKRETARKNDAVTMVEAIQEVNRTLQTSGGSTGGGTTSGTDEGVKGAIEGLGEGINNTDVETDSTPSDGIASFYDPEYPNGFQDVWSKNKSLFDNSEMNQYLDSWKLSASGNPPIMNACFNMGFIDFGCNDFTIDPRIFPFLRIIMLVSAAFLCRALIFGG
ncbi:hypothetical protein [Shewanella glacialipiscicola]|uniref:hypothetical protein n=1 Tax=Shewanella glacialipiscicola TaxID=614069 RepID=UPI003D793490